MQSNIINLKRDRSLSTDALDHIRERLKDRICTPLLLDLEHLQPLAPQEALKIAPWGRTGAKRALGA